MTKKERILKAFSGEEPDKVPKGELAIEAELKKKLLQGSAEGADSYVQEQMIREILKMDLVHIHEYPVEFLKTNEDGTKLFRGAFGEKFKAASHSTHLVEPALDDITKASSWKIPQPTLFKDEGVNYFVKKTDFFVSAQIGGPISMVQWALGMEDAMILSLTEKDNVKILSDKIMEYELFRALSYLEHGADMILIADDIGINTGLLYPPDTLKELAYPLYKTVIKEIKRYKDVPVMMHSDGFIMDALDDITACGFNGIQSLQPSAGMDIVEIKKRYGKDLLLMGNMDLDYLMTLGSPGEVEAGVEQLIAIAAPGGGFILSTCNILTDAIPSENAVAMYDAAERVGVYPIRGKSDFT